MVYHGRVKDGSIVLEQGSSSRTTSTAIPRPAMPADGFFVLYR
jgi:hypothetical protein